MVIKKFLHSCILAEKEGKKLLIDPGDLSFFEKKASPEDIGGVDVVLFTHRHPDHFYPEVLKEILTHKQATILTHKEVGGKLSELEIPYETVSVGETKVVEGFTVEAVEAPHGSGLKVPLYNLGFKVDGTFFHPGDCVSLERVEAKVLALPVVGSWMRFSEAVEFAKRVRPQYVIPIHDVLIKDVFLERVYKYYQEQLEKEGIFFYPLALGETLDF